jgi:hypothetical protein
VARPALKAASAWETEEGSAAREAAVENRPFRNQSDRNGRWAICDPHEVFVPAQADAAEERGGEVVAVALELEPFGEKLGRIRLAALQERRGDEPEAPPRLRSNRARGRSESRSSR